MIKGLTRREYQDLVLSVGTHRGKRRLSPLEVAILINRGVQAGLTRRECAEQLGLGTTQIGAFLKLLTLHESIAHLAAWGGGQRAHISFSSLSQLARLSPTDQVQAAEAILTYSLKWNEVVQLVQIMSRSHDKLDVALQKVLKLRPTIEKRFLFVGAVLSSRVKDCLAAMSAAERSAVFDRVLHTRLGLGHTAAGNLGQQNFTIVTGVDLTYLLGQSADEVELKVNFSLDTECSQR